MPGGYDKSPDYGGPEPNPKLLIAAAIAVLGGVGLLVWWVG